MATKPLAIARINRTKPKLEEYKRMVQEHERETAIGNGTLSQQGCLGNLLLSHASAIIAGLGAYGMHQDFVNQMWVLSFSRLLRQKLVEAAAKEEAAKETMSNKPDSHVLSDN